MLSVVKPLTFQRTPRLAELRSNLNHPGPCQALHPSPGSSRHPALVISRGTGLKPVLWQGSYICLQTTIDRSGICYHMLDTSWTLLTPMMRVGAPSDNVFPPLARRYPSRTTRIQRLGPSQCWLVNATEPSLRYLLPAPLRAMISVEKAIVVLGLGEKAMKSPELDCWPAQQRRAR